MDDPTFTCSPSQLTQRARAGDPGLLDDLFACYRDDLLAFLRHRCGHGPDADDALQDAFLAAARHLEGFRGDAPVRSWLYRLASNACTRMRRGRKADPSLHVPFPDLASADQAAVEAALEARLVPLRSALAGLSETDRAVLLLRDGQGMSAREAADALALSEKAVKSRLYRARKQVREALS